MAIRESPVFYPESLRSLKNYTPRAFLADATAGVIVGLVALPLAIAFAIASGVSPDKGLVTAIVAGFLISALGGSKVQIGGPTGAFVVIIAGIVERYGIDGLTLCTLMAGAMLVVMGVCRLGSVIKFMPYPLVVGFTSGIAVIIFSQQIKNLLGLTCGPVPSDFLHQWRLYASALPTAQPAAVAVSAGSLAILLAWPRFNRRVPGPAVALIAATAVVKLFHLPVETIGSRFGALPSGLPPMTLPNFDASRVKLLVSPAFTVAMLGAIESLLSATVADGMIEGRHNSNTELIAQGIANLACPLFGGIPATGAIARTATNVKNGGRTPVAGMIHALTLLAIILAFGRLAALIPLAALASILVVVSYHMSEWRSFRALLKAPGSDIAVLVSTFLLTVFVDLTVAVEVGMLFSLVLFVKRMTDVTQIREITEELERENEPGAADALTVPPGILVYEAEGAFFFGVASQLRDTLSLGAVAPRAVVLRMRHVLALDASGLRALSDLRRTCERNGAALILTGLHSQPLSALKTSGIYLEFGAENVLPLFSEGLARARAAAHLPPG